MALFPHIATVMLLPQGKFEPTINPNCIVLHTNGGPGSGPGLWNYWANPPSDIFSHFQVDADGRAYQYQDTALEAPAEFAGNLRGVSIETQDFGNPDTPWTRAQALKIAEIVAAVCHAHNIPATMMVYEQDHGVGYHSLFPDWNRNSHRCLPVDTTEILTRGGWVGIADVTMSDEVASWSADSGLIRFERPLGLIPTRDEPTIMLRGFEMTPDHSVYAAYINVHKPELRVFKSRPAVSMSNAQHHIPAAGRLAEARGLPLSDDELRLLVWTQADGHMATGNGADHLDFHFGRARKVDRVVALLERMGLDYRRTDCANSTVRLKVYERSVLNLIARWLPDKAYSWEWLDLSDSQVATVFDECQEADGSRKHRMLVSDINKTINADIMQALAVTHGWVSVSESGRLRLHKPGKDYITYAGHRDIGLGRSGTPVACVTTVDDTLIVRQDGRVVILGNCPGAVRVAQIQFVLANLPSGVDDVALTYITHDGGKEPRLLDTNAHVGAILGPQGAKAMRSGVTAGLAKVYDLDVDGYNGYVANGSL